MTDQQKVWGIDVSPTRIAVAVYSPDGTRWARTSPLNEGPQYEAIRDALIAASRENGEPTDVCIEQPALPFARAAYMAGAVCARTQDAVLGRWPHVVIRWMQPSEWRKIAGLGGRASKHDVYEWSCRMEFDPGDQDQADASAIAYARYVEMVDEE
jgi:hypothetical protein